MDPRERQAAIRQLALLELLLAAQERRHEVLDLVWESTDTKQAAERLRKLLDIQDGTDPRIVLDMQVGRLTHEARAQLASNVNNLRNILRSP